MKNLITTALGHYLNSMAKISPQTAGRHGFNIFCYPFSRPLKSYHKAFLQTSEMFNFNFENLIIQGYKWGRGPKKLLFVHGWQSHSFQWKNYVQALPQDQFTIYAIDAPGHGLSQGKILNVPFYSNVISRLLKMTGSIDTVVSHSLGSFSILHLLHTNPHIPINKLVIMAPPGKAIDFFHFYKTKLKLNDHTVKFILDYFEKEIQKPIDFFSTTNFASGLHIPGLIIHDKEDEEAPYENALLINQVWENSQLITTKGLKHNLKSPEVFNVVKDFILEHSYVRNE